MMGSTTASHQDEGDHSDRVQLVGEKRKLDEHNTSSSPKKQCNPCLEHVEDKSTLKQSIPSGNIPIHNINSSASDKCAVQINNDNRHDASPSSSNLLPKKQCRSGDASLVKRKTTLLKSPIINNEMPVPTKDSGTSSRKNGKSPLKSQPSNSPLTLAKVLAPTKPTKKKKKVKSEEEASELEFTWICTECKEAECLEDEDAPLIICDGKCNRPFHPPCANLIAIPPKDQPWLCGDCVQQRHQCTVCKEYGTDDIDVFCCDAKGCGLFFHENCLNMYSVNVEIVEEEVQVRVKDDDDDVYMDASAEEKKDCDEEDGGGLKPPSSSTTKVSEKTITQIVSRPKFRCPAHECWTCANETPPRDDDVDGSKLIAKEASDSDKKPKRGGKKGKKRKSGTASAMSMWGAKKDRLFRCLHCPISYHLTCMPPSCSFHELAMLCHEHAYTSKLPYLDAGYSLQAAVEAGEEKKLEILKQREEKRVAATASVELLDSDNEKEEIVNEKDNPFLPGLVGSAKVHDEDQLTDFLFSNTDSNTEGRKQKKRRHFDYCLPCDFKEEVHSKPPAYTHVNANRYNPQNKPKRHPPSGETCNCQPIDGEDFISCSHWCLNRAGFVECVGDKNSKSGERNPYFNCNCGPNCGNRALSKRQFAKCRPMREHGKGWGLITVDGVKTGDLVQEYAGEIIDEETKEERLKAWARDHPNDPNFYIMSLQPGWYVDAREVANMARFINHSCDPNCKLFPVNVAGRMRISIVCIRDVPPGGFLCYDYRFDTQHDEQFSCRCGAKNCRRTMGLNKRENADDNKVEKRTKSQLIADAKKKHKLDKKYLKDVMESETKRLYLTGQFVPGEDRERADLVAGGPMTAHRNEARETRVFLWRNAWIGGNFSNRYWKKQHKKKPRHNLATLRCCHATVDVISAIKD